MNAAPDEIRFRLPRARGNAAWVREIDTGRLDGAGVCPAPERGDVTMLGRTLMLWSLQREPGRVA